MVPGWFGAQPAGGATLTAMRKVYPDVIPEVDPADSYSDVPVATGRPAVRLNMIVSVDGGTSWGGVSGALGGPADKSLFAVLRSLADLIVVAAGTMRSESYGPATLPDAIREARRARGQTAVPPIAVVTRSCRLDWDTPFFTAAEERPLVITVCDADARPGAAESPTSWLRARVTSTSRSRSAELARRGVQSVLAEGGPTLNGELARADLLGRATRDAGWRGDAKDRSSDPRRAACSRQRRIRGRRLLVPSLPPDS